MAGFEIVPQIDLQRLQVSMIEKMAAILGPASSLPICKQISATDGERAQSIVADVLIDLDAAIFQETFKRNHLLRA